MAKTTFAHGMQITPEFLNAINNPTYSDDPQEDGQIPYPQKEPLGITALETAVQALQQRISRVVYIPRTGETGFQWYGFSALVDSADSALAGKAIYSHVRYADGLLSISYQAAILRSTFSAWPSIAPVELRVQSPGADLLPLLTYLQAAHELYFPCILSFDNGIRRNILVRLSSAFVSGSDPYIFMQLRDYSYGDMLTDCDTEDEGEPATRAVIQFHVSVVTPQLV